MSASIHVSPSTSCFWEELDEFRVSALDPFQLYHIELSLEHKTRFRSVAYYFADENGEVDLSKEAPVFGMYDGVDKMGLFTSLYTHPGEKITAKLNLSPLPEKLTYKVTVFFHDSRKKIAEVEVSRLLQHPNVSRSVVEHSLLEGVLYVPKYKGTRKLPCVLDVYGVAMGTREHRASMLAAQGYCVFALAIFGTGKLSKQHEDVTSEYLQEAVKYLTGLQFTDNFCAIVGTSFGGTLAYHTAFKMDEVVCAVSINGQRGHYMVSQLNENGEKLPWTQVLPHNMPLVKYSKGFVSYAEMYGSCELDDEHMLKFKDFKTHQHFMYIAGGQDGAIDGIVQGREIRKILENAGNGARFELLELPDCGHVVDPPYMPVNDYLYQGGRYMAFGGEPYPHGKGQIVAWRAVLDFLRRHIGEGIKVHEFSKI